MVNRSVNRRSFRPTRQGPPVPDARLAAPWLVLPVAIALVGFGPTATAAQTPLFTSDETIELTLEADFKALRGDRDQENEERPARLVWNEPSGTSASAELQVRTRGNFRLKSKNCRMPPLRLNFRTGAMEGTLFEGQDKVKLVTFCRDKDDYEQNVIEEYLVYRMYNLVTDESFRVRPLRITYVDTSQDDDPVTRFGFLIESEEALSARLGGTMLEVPAAHPESYPVPETPRLALFQYMIGNTDWSMVRFHNVKLFLRPDGTAVPVPYDFDWSGVVSASYARPDASLGTRNVRQRLYRGFCRDGVDFSALYARFQELEPEFMAVIASVSELQEDKQRKLQEYLTDFYKTIGDPGRAERSIEKDCRPMPGG